MNTLHHNTAVPSDGHLLTRSEQPELLLERGYTGHKHLPQFGLINMNARLYEPLTARFLSPDPEAQAPDFSQNLNRYSYCLNNPFRYIDPTGEVIKLPNKTNLFDFLMIIFDVFPDGKSIDIQFDDNGPAESSLKHAADVIGELFFSDFAFISSSEKVVEIFISDYNLYNYNGRNLVIEELLYLSDMPFSHTNTDENYFIIRERPFKLRFGYDY